MTARGTARLRLVPLPSLLHIAVLMQDPLGQEGGNRRRVYALVQDRPGLHQREIARQLGLSQSSAEHHLRHLVKAGLLLREQTPGFVRFSVAVQGVSAPSGAVPAQDRPKLHLLRQAKPLEIVAVLLQEDGLAMHDLARRVRLSPPAVTYQVGKLERVGIARRDASGTERRVHLVDREALVQLLLAYEPPSDLVAGFESLWEGVGL